MIRSSIVLFVAFSCLLSFGYVSLSTGDISPSAASFDYNQLILVQGLPENLIQMIRKFASELDSWLRSALEDLPENLRAVKIDRRF